MGVRWVYLSESVPNAVADFALQLVKPFTLVSFRGFVPAGVSNATLQPKKMAMGETLTFEATF